MPFRPVFIAIVIAFALILGAFVRATGKCAECHSRMQYSVVHEFEMSKHGANGVTCLDCHQPAQAQQKKEHNGFIITTQMTAGNCRSCHDQIYQEFLRSRHAAPAWSAVFGEKGLSPEQVAFSEQYNPGHVKRPANALAQVEGVDRPDALQLGDELVTHRDVDLLGSSREPDLVLHVVVLREAGH